MTILAVENNLARLIEGKSDDERVEVPVAVLREFLRSRGEKTLTTQQAADLLGVSRPFVVKLIDEGKLAAQKVGTHRRINESEIENWKARNRENRLESLRKLTELDEELGLNQAL